ncbi:hypothetical protein BTJ40_06840 [Microbulbifer sp. A4B17]|nr:hypothetical protein BTJ40_06840 [Microbulbifer sp. A4B17]
MLFRGSVVIIFQSSSKISPINQLIQNKQWISFIYLVMAVINTEKTGCTLAKSITQERVGYFIGN